MRRLAEKTVRVYTLQGCTTPVSMHRQSEIKSRTYKKNHGAARLTLLLHNQTVYFVQYTCTAYLGLVIIAKGLPSSMHKTDKSTFEEDYAQPEHHNKGGDTAKG